MQSIKNSIAVMQTHAVVLGPVTLRYDTIRYDRRV